MLISVKEKDFKSVITENKIVVVDFWASWCRPCLAFAPIFSEFSDEVSHVTCAKINVDEEKELAELFNIRSIPTIMVFKDGKVSKTVLGIQSKSALYELIK